MLLLIQMLRFYSIFFVFILYTIRLYIVHYPSLYCTLFLVFCLHNIVKLVVP